MRKGVSAALEIIFIVIILIVVTFIIIRFFTGVVGPSSLPNIQDFRETYDYERQRQYCENLCNRYTQGGCKDYDAATSYCLQSIALSIDGNNAPKERGHYGMVANLPYCEDGLYCFHIHDCSCGYYRLDAKNCLIVLQTYYTEEKGLTEEQTNSIICSSITPGSCCPEPTTCSPKQWKIKPTGFDPKTYPDIDATHWWVNAGYEEYCGSAVASAPALSFDCNFKPPDAIECSWSGCAGNGVLSIKGMNNQVDDRVDITTESGSHSFSNLDAGDYFLVIVCPNSNPPQKTETETVR